MAGSIKITGMYSGLDTDTIVKRLMEIEQYKVDRQFRSKVNMQWKQEALKKVNDDIKELKNTYFSVLGSSNMYSKNIYNVYDVTMLGSNTSAVTIKADYSATAGSHVINQVNRLAQACNIQSAESVSLGSELSPSNSTKLKDLDFKNSMNFVDGTVSFKINGETFSFSEEDTLQNVLNTVNSNGNAGVILNYSRLSDTFKIESKKTGADPEIIIENITGTAFGESGAFGIATGTYKNGEDAEVIIDGITVTRSSNTFTIDGITYTLNEKTDPDADIGFRLTQNADKAVESIKGFVDAYNLLILKLDTLLVERKARDERGYTPLTEAEKEAMSDEQIEKWEAIAKKGLLYNDRSIRSMLDRLRSTLYATVADAGVSPAQIGIKTGHWTNKGQITLDEDALRSALENDPHQVMSVFTNISSSDDASVKYSENGLLKRISDVFDSYTKSSGTALSSLGEDIDEMVDKIDLMEEKMMELEEKYYQKYAAMETALAKLQSQSDWLGSMLGSLNK